MAMEIFGGAGWLMTILLGIAGALLMTLLGRAVGWYDPNEGAHVVAAILGSVILLFIYRRINKGRTGPPSR
jgi:uncharacterized membrane protein YeaQ/YmgE (transglycosylase-associated protein family)